MDNQASRGQKSEPLQAIWNKIQQAFKDKPWLWAIVVVCSPLMPFLLPVLVPALIILIIYQAVQENKANDLAPIQTVSAVIVTKRLMVSGESTSYYVTFELQTGERLELRLAGSEYGLLVEGDRGTLTYQRTRYHSFMRLSGS